MVMYELIEENKKEAVYEYFPENKHDKIPGKISYNKDTQKISLIQLAETDYMESVSLEELLDFRNSVNETMIEERGFVLSEDEWPIPTDGFTVAAYGDMAMRDIAKKIKTGTIPKKGMSVWY